MANKTKKNGKSKASKANDKVSENTDRAKRKSNAKVAIGAIVTVALAAFGFARYMKATDDSVTISNSPNTTVQKVSQSTTNNGTIEQNLTVGIVKDDAVINMNAPSPASVNDPAPARKEKANK